MMFPHRLTGSWTRGGPGRIVRRRLRSARGEVQQYRPVLAFRPRLPRAEPPALAASPGAASLGQQSHENHGGDGHPSFAPLIQGKYSIEPWSDALAPRWEAVYEPQSPGCWPGPA